MSKCLCCQTELECTPKFCPNCGAKQECPPPKYKICDVLYWISYALKEERYDDIDYIIVDKITRDNVSGEYFYSTEYGNRQYEEGYLFATYELAAKRANVEFPRTQPSKLTEQ